ncbi:MAG: Na+/H+ antiporter subunit E [Bacillota bacterium]|nr:Na+/H+ antiporter subunit E [Bacillota bacterium]
MPKTRFVSVIVTFFVCYLFWILINWSLNVEELIAGAVISLLVALFASRFFIHTGKMRIANPLRLFSLIWYCLVVFIEELAKANWDMAKRSFSRGPNINPGIVKVPVDVHSEYGLSMLANSITMTPGTITMDIVEEDGRNYFYIHWINVEDGRPEAAGELIKGRLEKWTRRIWE